MTKILSEVIFPVLSLMISLLPLFFSLRNERKEKFSISVDFLTDDNSEWLVDRLSNNNPDVYFFNQYRLFLTIVITNNSSLPVTIKEFSINEDIIYNSFSRLENEYKVTIKNDIEEVAPGITVGGQGKSVVAEINDSQYLLPPITIKTYESVVGVIGFHYNESIVGTNLLKVNTSRGIKVLDLTILKQYVSKARTDYIPPIL